MQAVRTTRMHALLAVAVFCLVAAAVATGAGPPARAALAYAFAVGFGVLVLFSGKWPMWILMVTATGIVAYYALDLPPVGLATPFAAALFAAAERGRALWAGVAGAVLLAVSVTVRLIEGDDLSVVLGLGLGSDAVLMLAVIALGDAVRSRRSLKAEMTRQAAAAEQERRREAARQVDAERVRIARELHDTLGHTMSVISIQSAVAEEALTDGTSPAACDALTAIRTASASAMAELRATLGTLRGDDGNLAPALGIEQLPELVERTCRSGLPVELRITGPVDALPTVVSATVYRVVQEALTNALRHARAHHVTVTIQVSTSDLSLAVVDDGEGASTVLTEVGHGLRGMTERVTLLGGDLQAGNVAGRGYAVRASLPLAGVRA